MTADKATAFIDAVCSKYRCRIGWHGRFAEMPACRRCGCRPPQEELDASQKKMDDFRELLREIREANPGWDKWRKARVAAGLTLRQAAKLLGVTPSNLSEIEQGQNQPSQALATRMSLCYGGEQP